MLTISPAQAEALSHSAATENIDRFRDILIDNGTIAPGEDRDDELRRYQRAGWDLGLRKPRDLVMFSAACFRAGGDIGRDPVVRDGVTAALDDPAGPMTRLMLDLPVTFWNELPARLARLPGSSR